MLKVVVVEGSSFPKLVVYFLPAPKIKKEGAFGHHVVPFGVISTDLFRLEGVGHDGVREGTHFLRRSLHAKSINIINHE